MSQFSLSEKNLIADLRKRFASDDRNISLGIGDDAAVVRVGEKLLAVTKDMLVQDVHFFPDHPPELLARKSLSVNLSDCAAMGAKPRFALLGMGLPGDTDPGWIERYLHGLEGITAEYDVRLIGGDITAAPKIVISITLLGEGDKFVQRSGAEAGHSVYVSGLLGEASQGLELARQGIMWGADAASDRFLRAFYDPVPQVDLGCRLAAHQVASAMIDISDGLSVDLGHLCRESGTGALVEAASLPISPELREAAPSALQMALHGGEDYGLLFTVSAQTEAALTRKPLGHKVTRIGHLTKDADLMLILADGTREPLTPEGFQHFRKG
jgi:thiamine-monophosphate kinase